MALRIPLLSLLLISMAGMSACSDSESSSIGGRAGLIGTPEALARVPDDDPGNTTISPASAEIAAIAGLWNDSEVQSSNGAIDVFYLEITADGLWNSFDFRGDGVDLGPNCYTLLSGRVSSLGGTRYQLSIGQNVVEFSGMVSNGNLVITAAVGTFTLPPLIGVSSADFNLC